MCLFADIVFSQDVTARWRRCQVIGLPTLILKRGMESALGARMAGHANLARGHHEEFTTLKRFNVLLEYGIELFDFRLEGCSGESEEDDAGMDKSLVEDQFAEIAVGDHQNPSLCPGD